MLLKAFSLAVFLSLLTDIAHAQDTKTAIRITPSSGPVGSKATITGSNFPVGRVGPLRIDITIDANRPLGDPVYATGSAFSTDVTVPRLPTGTYTINASAFEKVIATTAFTVTAQARATPTPAPTLTAKPIYTAVPSAAPAPQSPTEMPDLAISFVTHGFDDEQNLTFSVRIANLGKASSPETMLRIQELDHNLAEGTAPVPPLRPGQTFNAPEITMRVPAEYPGITLRFLVEIDPRGEIRESNRGNNRFVTDVTMPEPLPEPNRGWILPVLLAGAVVMAGTAFSVKKWLRKPKAVKVRNSDGIGIQRIASDTPVCWNDEVCFRPVSDPGEQRIEAKGELTGQEIRRANE